MTSMKRTLFIALVAFCLPVAVFSAGRTWTLSSPDGRINAEIRSDGKVTYSISFDGKVILAPSEISMSLGDGRIFGEGAVRSIKTGSVAEHGLPAIAYKEAAVDNVYNWLTLNFRDCAIEFRAFDDAVAYRFVSTAKKGSLIIQSEQVGLNFPEDWTSWVPYVSTSRIETFETQFRSSFESYYKHIKLSEWNPARLAFLPVVVDAADGVKVLITESDLRDYPGLFLNGKGGQTLEGVFAPYPKTVVNEGREGVVKEREDFIAKAEAGKRFPWRIVGIFEDEKDLTDCDLVWKLATPEDKTVDWSWVKPGKVAWDWWSDWTLAGVDFKAGVNNDTYKYFIDFASKYGIEYVLLDAGWSDKEKYDLFQVVPAIDIKELVRYADERNVGLVLWGAFTSVTKDMDHAFRHYSEIGIKGFKVDYLNRDDQLMVAWSEEIARTAAKYHLIIDFHGVFKPTGLERTYPNIVNYEGVAGLEQMKWGAEKSDQVTYDVTVPFIRMAAGRMDYTQGAMINCTKGKAFSNYASPMSQGTRCHQLAEYAIFDSPFAMLCDSPSLYLAEPEFTEFLSLFPAAWDETVPVCGNMGEYVAVARRKGSDWFVGALTDWNERDLVLDLGFIGGGKMTIFQDGANAEKAARDYRKTTSEMPSDGKVIIHMAPGGGWAARITP